MRSRALNLAALAFLVGLFGSIGGGTGPATAQQLDAGKPPAQIFNGTCAACHRSPRGLVRSVSPGALPGFLRQHYTTGNDMAGTMAAYVLGSGGTQQVAEPPSKREPKQEPRQEPKQRAKSDASEVAARTPEPKEQSKSAKQRAAKKGQPEPSAKEVPQPQEPDKAEAAKPEAPAAKPEPPAEQAKPETVAGDCKVEQQAKQADETKPGLVMAEPPRQPAALLTLPGFPAPVPEPEPEPAAKHEGCEPAANGASTPARADTSPAEQPKEQVKEQPKDEPKEAAPAASPSTAASSAAMAEAPKSEPLRTSVSEPAPLDIMREEVHAPRPARPIQQKKREAPQ
jgi:hypothetical protein